MEAPSDDFVVLKNLDGRSTTLVDLRLVPAIEFTAEDYIRVHFNGSWLAVPAKDHPEIIDAWKQARDFAAYVPNN